MATHRPRLPPEICMIKASIQSEPISRIIAIIMDPIMLNSKWINAARFAFFLPLRLASIADIQAPMLHPRIMKKQIFSGSSPCCASKRTILTVTDELCTIAVIISPRSNAKKRLSKDMKRFWIAGSSFNAPMEDDMVLIPRKRIPKPMTTSPAFFTVGFLKIISIRTPTIINTGAYWDRLKDTSCDVTVVPILAP